MDCSTLSMVFRGWEWFDRHQKQDKECFVVAIRDKLFAVRHYWCVLLKVRAAVFCWKYVLMYSVESTCWCLLLKIRADVFCWKYALMYSVESTRWCILLKVRADVFCWKYVLMYSAESTCWCILLKVRADVFRKMRINITVVGVFCMIWDKEEEKVELRKWTPRMSALSCSECRKIKWWLQKLRMAENTRDSAIRRVCNKTNGVRLRNDRL